MLQRSRPQRSPARQWGVGVVQKELLSPTGVPLCVRAPALLVSCSTGFALAVQQLRCFARSLCSLQGVFAMGCLCLLSIHRATHALIDTRGMQPQGFTMFIEGRSGRPLDQVHHVAEAVARHFRTHTRATTGVPAQRHPRQGCAACAPQSLRRF